LKLKKTQKAPPPKKNKKTPKHTQTQKPTGLVFFLKNPGFFPFSNVFIMKIIGVYCKKKKILLDWQS